MRYILVCTMFLVACDTTRDAQTEAPEDVVGQWTATMSLHDNIPCFGEMTISSNHGVLSGTWFCQDSSATPAGSSWQETAPGSTWITYGAVAGTIDPMSASVSIRNYPTDGGGAFFTDTVVADAASMTGARIAARRK